MAYRRSLVIILCSVAASSWFACASPNDIGKACVLVRRATLSDGGIGTADLTIADVSTAGVDYISFGVSDCDRFVCIRDGVTFSTVGQQPTDAAGGYCSQPCPENSTTSCNTGNGSIDNDPDQKFYCRGLVLDEATIARICQENPDKCAQLGNATSSSYCARGASQT